jgi:rhodanese-related sulfurtransferase
MHQIEQDQISALEKYKQTPIIVICAAGITAAKGANKLVQAGFSQVNILDGGMGSWTNANLPVIKAK